MIKRALAADPPLLLSPEFAADPYKGLTIDIDEALHDFARSIVAEGLLPG